MAKTRKKKPIGVAATISSPHAGAWGMYITGTGQNIQTHASDACIGRACVIHNPSQHHMRRWPTHWRDDEGFMERLCPHGIGHPDPDDLAFRTQSGGGELLGVHGCDRCCIRSTNAVDSRDASYMEHIGDVSARRAAQGSD